MLTDIDGLLNDFNRELADYESGLTFDESVYHETEDRLNLIQRSEDQIRQQHCRDPCTPGSSARRNWRSWMIMRTICPACTGGEAEIEAETELKELSDRS